MQVKWTVQYKTLMILLFRQTLCFFTSKSSVYCCDKALRKFWSGLGTKTVSVMEKIMFWLEMPIFVATKMLTPRKNTAANLFWQSLKSPGSVSRDRKPRVVMNSGAE